MLDERIRDLALIAVHREMAKRLCFDSTDRVIDSYRGNLDRTLKLLL